MTSKKRIIFLDADGTNEEYLGVIIEYPTGIIYRQQCGGTDCTLRDIEGYYVPLGGLKLEFDDGNITPADLTIPFHSGKRCNGGEPTSVEEHTKLSKENLELLNNLVESIPFWVQENSDSENIRVGLKVSYFSNINEKKQGTSIIEAWVPVDTPDGNGVLVWSNCD